MSRQSKDAMLALSGHAGRNDKAIVAEVLKAWR